ncbi:HTH-type transcriptional regulator AcrR [Pseudogemmobacter humi]|uniref:HTH-type transcriptional regulator AcrR n=2 Tax=Pseudogemmobacter humi TaxID=2483812 RepID=A0A3P5WPR6_9RHOB|nr:HTH-type transcriptional regulator AcrR [Pseudogemmobacter humi]
MTKGPAAVANRRAGGHDGAAMSSIPEPEVRRGRKFEQVVDGALRVFLRDGFEGASVDEIAREAGVSKATLYSYFPDKRIMFAEVFSAECHRQADRAETELARTPGAREFLTFAGQRVIEFTLSDFGRRLFRLIVAEVARFPELAREFYSNGPGLLRRKLVERLRELSQRGELSITDYDLAADQFVQLCRAAVHDRLMLDLVQDIRPEEVAKSVESAVEMFMARYGARGEAERAERSG